MHFSWEEGDAERF